MKILIFGAGWIGQKCAAAWPEAILISDLIKNTEQIENIITTHQPDAVLNAAGIVGKPNVDWCETHQTETIFGNTILPLMIAEVCQKHNVYLLHIGTGCIFYGTAPHQTPWKESDFANPVAVYSRAKYAADLCLSTLPNVGVGRIRMPIDNEPSPANYISKVASFKKLIDVENSMTVISDMIIAFRALIEKRGVGIFHVVNPGSIKLREIIQMYDELVDPSHTNEWIREEDLVTEGLATKKRSNNIMASDNLIQLGINMRPIKEAVRDALTKYAQIKNQL